MISVRVRPRGDNPWASHVTYPRWSPSEQHLYNCLAVSFVSFHSVHSEFPQL